MNDSAKAPPLFAQVRATANTPEIRWGGEGNPRGGGCEIFVTKLGILSPSSARMIEKSDKVAMLSKETRMYCFEKLDDLLGAVRAVGLRVGNTKIESDVYILDDTFYLSLDEQE